MAKSRLFTPATRRTPGPIGIDPGQGVLRLVQLESDDTGLSVRVAAEQPYPAGEAGSIGKAVWRALRSAPFAGRRVIAAIPRDLLHVRTVRVTGPASAGGTRAAAFSEAAGLFPFQLSDAVVRFLPAGEVRGAVGSGAGEPRLEVIVLAALRRDVDALVKQLHSAGVLVQSLEPGPCALFRASRPLLHPGPTARVLVEVDEQQTLVAIGREARINFVKSIDIGAWHFDQAVARKLNVTHAEASSVRGRIAADAGGEPGMGGMPPGGAGDRDAVSRAVADSMRCTIEELARTLATFIKYNATTFPGPGLQYVHLMGVEAENEILRAWLSVCLGKPVVSHTPPSGPPGAPSRPEMGPPDIAAPEIGPPLAGPPLGRFAVASGLALKTRTGGGRRYKANVGQLNEVALG